MWLSTAINLPGLSLQNDLLGIIIETGKDSNMSNTLRNHLMLIFKKIMYDMRTSVFPPSIYVLYPITYGILRFRQIRGGGGGEGFLTLTQKTRLRLSDRFEICHQ